MFDSPDQKAETLKDTEGTFKITMEEDATLLYFYVQEGDFESKKDYDLFVKKVADYIHDNFDNKANSASGQRLPFAVKEEGKWKPIISQSGEEHQVTSDATQTRPVYIQQLKAGENNLTITGLQPQKECTIWAMTIDRAGNMDFTSTDGKKFTTTKAMPRY